MELKCNIGYNYCVITRKRILKINNLVYNKPTQFYHSYQYVNAHKM